MIIAKVEGGSVTALLDHRNYFSNPPADDEIKAKGYFPVSHYRAHDSATQKLVKVEPYVYVDRVYTVEVQDMTAEEIAAKEALRVERQAESVRKTRDRLLADSDWTVLQDSPLTDAQTADWVIYRQALRDITAHENFPDLNSGMMDGETSDWPSKPE